MPRRRRNSSSSESEDLPTPKRARPFSIDESDLDYEPSAREEPKLNPTYGQRGAFPGLEDGGDEDELFYGPASNGLEYLRMVRSEAKGVPHVLVGPNQIPQRDGEEGYTEEDGEEGGYYEDGAFIGAPEPTSNLTALRHAQPDAQEAYYLSLSARFKDVRISLHQTPPFSAIEALTPDHPISLPPDSAKAKQQWRYLLQNQEPRMAQLACMDMESVLEVVKLLTSLLAGTVRSRSREKIQRLSAWTWGILGKCNDAGQLGSEEISELRELGKRAVGLLVGIRDRSGKVYGYQKDEEEEEAEKAEEDVIEDGLERSEEDEIHVPTRRSADQQITDPTATAMEGYSEAAPKDNELEHAKAVLQARLHLEEQPQLNGTQAKEGEVEEDTSNKLVEMSVDKQVRVLLDMVITIIGEFYGQRDLLEFRDIWDEELSSPSV